MIARLKGKLIEKRPNHAILDVSGVGYRVFITISCFEKLPPEGQTAEFYTVTVVRDDALHLYGFHDAEEKEMFEKLLGVSKVGPKLAVQALSGVEAGELARIIADGNAAAMSAIPGIGKKTAERIILELKDKLGHPSIRAESGLTDNIPSTEALMALENLGYKKKDAEKAVARASHENPESDLAGLIRAALKELSPHS